MQRLIFPFVAGFLAVPFFQQSAIALLHAAALTDALPYATAPVAPFGVPGFIVDAVIGGLWGIVLAWLLRIAPEGRAPWIGALMFGGVALSATSIFLVGPLQGVWPTGNILPRVVFDFAINAMWGWGALVFMRAFMTLREQD